MLASLKKREGFVVGLVPVDVSTKELDSMPFVLGSHLGVEVSSGFRSEGIVERVLGEHGLASEDGLASKPCCFSWSW